jgi:hypothetical protein
MESTAKLCCPHCSKEINLTVSPTKEKVIVIKEKKKTPHEQVSKMLSALKIKVGVDHFADSKLERAFANHFLSLMEMIGKEELSYRIETIALDPYHSKNCNRIQYLYNQVKGFKTPISELFIPEEDSSLTGSYHFYFFEGDPIVIPASFGKEIAENIGKGFKSFTYKGNIYKYSAVSKVEKKAAPKISSFVKLEQPAVNQERLKEIKQQLKERLSWK